MPYSSLAYGGWTSMPLADHSIVCKFIELIIYTCSIRMTKDRREKPPTYSQKKNL